MGWPLKKGILLIGYAIGSIINSLNFDLISCDGVVFDLHYMWGMVIVWQRLHLKWSGFV